MGASITWIAILPSQRSNVGGQTDHGLDMPEREPNRIDGLAACSSAPHRSVLRLTRVAMGYSAGPSLLADLKASDPEDLVRIATFNYLHAAADRRFQGRKGTHECGPKRPGHFLCGNAAGKPAPKPPNPETTSHHQRHTC